MTFSNFLLRSKVAVIRSKKTLSRRVQLLKLCFPMLLLLEKIDMALPGKEFQYLKPSNTDDPRNGRKDKIHGMQGGEMKYPLEEGCSYYKDHEDEGSADHPGQSGIVCIER
jgi:hypothetical protein